MLENSRLVGLIHKLEQGESVSTAELDRFALLQQLDLVRAGQIAAADAIRFHEEQDQRIERLLKAQIEQLYPDRPKANELVLS